MYLVVKSGSQVRLYLINYIKIGALVGVIASSLYFFIQVGAFSQTGLKGMFDLTMITILAQSGLGYASLNRVIAFTLVLAPISYKAKGYPKTEITYGFFSVFLIVISGLLIAYSFSQIGHVAELQIGARFAIGFHVLAISLWIGSLFPLFYLCKVEEIARLQKIMQRFGELAIVFVAVLILSGLYLLLQLLESPIELISTPYGITLILKLAGVSALLFLGALNKMRLVPNLKNNIGVSNLKRSIQYEIYVAFVVLIITAYLTTLIGI